MRWWPMTHKLAVDADALDATRVLANERLLDAESKMASAIKEKDAREVARLFIEHPDGALLKKAWPLHYAPRLRHMMRNSDKPERRQLGRFLDEVSRVTGVSGGRETLEVI